MYIINVADKNLATDEQCSISNIELNTKVKVLIKEM